MCGVSVSDAEQQELLSEFVAAGLARGERVWWFADAAEPDDVLDALGRAGVAVGQAIAGGRLAVGCGTCTATSCAARR